MLDAIEDWQLSRNESLTDLLFTEGQSRETYNVATSNVYAHWENGVGNLLGDKPEGTGWEKPETPIVTDSKSVPTLDKSVGYMTFDETTDEETSAKNSEDSPNRPGNPDTWKYKERTWIGAITEETAGYFYNYGYFLGVEVYTAGTTITETGAAIGDAVGEHSARMYFDPWEEFNILADSATELAIALKSLEQRFIADPVGTLQMVGNASIDYLDDLTSNPETSGKLLGNVAILWATTGANAGASTYLRTLFGATKAAQTAGAAGTTGAATSTTSQAANVARKVAGEVEDVLDKVEDVVDNVPVPKNVDAPDVPKSALKELVDEAPENTKVTITDVVDTIEDNADLAVELARRAAAKGRISSGSQAFGTRAHLYFERLNKRLARWLDDNGSSIKVEVEEFRNAAGKLVSRRAKGAIGADVKVTDVLDSTVLLIFDLKTHGGIIVFISKLRQLEFFRRFGANAQEIFRKR
jgi:hypothetical protein